MLQEVVQDVQGFYYTYENQGKKIALMIFFFVLLYEFFVSICLKKKFFKMEIVKRAIIMAILSFYIYVVIGITLLCRRGEYIDIVNLRLFSVFNRNFPDRTLIYENILLFVPYAILLFILAKPFRNIWVSLLTGVFSSLVLETMQRITRLGRFELDDLLMNGCGMLIGFIICKLIVFIGFGFHFFFNCNKRRNKGNMLEFK